MSGQERRTLHGPYRRLRNARNRSPKLWSPAPTMGTFTTGSTQQIALDNHGRPSQATHRAQKLCTTGAFTEGLTNTQNPYTPPKVRVYVTCQAQSQTHLSHQPTTRPPMRPYMHTQAHTQPKEKATYQCWAKFSKLKKYISAASTTPGGRHTTAGEPTARGHQRGEGTKR